MVSIILALLSILIWSTLAVLNTKVAALPALFSVGMALCVSGIVGLVRVRDWKIPAVTLAVGVGGIFGYHALLFAAFQLAPAVEVNLINYLWPLLIVVLSPLVLEGFELYPHHLTGALLGLAGAVLVVSGGRLSLDVGGLPGYLLAAAAAFLWAAYSLLTKRVPPFSTGAVGFFCLVSGLLSLGLWGGVEIIRTGTLALPEATLQEILYLVLLGLGPMGLAFYTWDGALKRGDPRVIGSLAYLTPLLSTLNLVVFGGKKLSVVSGAAMALIVAGAVVGATGKAREKA
jgi:drug/metabolite transporter (DMT)-like permease